jgi:hypothetical protein
VTDRLEHIAEWVKLTEEKNKRASCADIPKPCPKGAIRAAERELGIEHTEANGRDEQARHWKPPRPPLSS